MICKCSKARICCDVRRRSLLNGFGGCSLAWEPFTFEDVRELRRETEPVDLPWPELNRGPLENSWPAVISFFRHEQYLNL